jgi:hypothetical protein
VRPVAAPRGQNQKEPAMRSSARKFTLLMSAALALTSLSALSACSSDSGSDEPVCTFAALDPPDPELAGTWCVTSEDPPSNQVPDPNDCDAQFGELPASGSDTAEWTVSVIGNAVTASVVGGPGSGGVLMGTASGLGMKLAGQLLILDPEGAMDIACAELAATVPSSGAPSFVGEASYTFAPDAGTTCTGALNISAVKGPCL